MPQTPLTPTLLDTTETTVEATTPAQSNPEPSPTSTAAEPFRHSNWRRTRNIIREALITVEGPGKRLNRFNACGECAWVFKHKSDPDKYRIGVDHCHDRWCLPCAQERSSRAAHKLKAALKGEPHRFITLTLKASNTPLKEQLDKLTTSFRKLRQTNAWKTTQRGGAAFLEITYNAQKQLWHPHLHIIAEGTFIHHADLKHDWQKITNDSFIVNIKLIRNPETTISYIAKYASKPLAPSVVANATIAAAAIEALKSKRMILTFGTWKNVRLSKETDPSEWEKYDSLNVLRQQAASGSCTARSILISLACDGNPPNNNRDYSELWKIHPNPHDDDYDPPPLIRYDDGDYDTFHNDDWSLRLP